MENSEKTKQKGIFDPVLDSVKKQRLNRLVNSFIFDDKSKNS